MQVFVFSLFSGELLIKCTCSLVNRCTIIYHDFSIFDDLGGHLIIQRGISTRPASFCRHLMWTDALTVY